MRDYAPDPKPQRRIRDDSAGREKLARERRCRLCGRRPGQPIYRPSTTPGYPRVLDGYVLPLSRHHLVARGQGGDDVDDNLVPLCGHGTAGCHGEVEHSRDARRRLRARLSAAEYAYIVAKKGSEWLNRRYPGGSAAPPPSPSAGAG